MVPEITLHGDCIVASIDEAVSVSALKDNVNYG